MSDETVQLTPRYTAAEFQERGEVLHKKILPTLKSEDMGKFLAIDIDSGEFEVGDDDYGVIDRLLQRKPHAQSWLCRVGYTAVYRLGGRIPLVKL